MFWGTARAAKVTTFYKIAAFRTSRAAIFGSFGDGFPRRRDGLFFARDGHYDSNDHREHRNDGFRVARKLPFSPSPPLRRAYRLTTEGLSTPARCRNAENVYLCNIRKIFTMRSSKQPVCVSSQEAPPTQGPPFAFLSLARLPFPSLSTLLYIRTREREASTADAPGHPLADAKQGVSFF